MPALQYWRQHQRLTQLELAQEAQLSRVTVAKAEGGKRVSLASAERLATALAVTVTKLQALPPESAGSN